TVRSGAPSGPPTPSGWALFRYARSGPEGACEDRLKPSRESGARREPVGPTGNCGSLRVWDIQRPKAGGGVMRGLRSGFWLLAVGALLSLVGCLTTEVRSASDALEAARRAGKDKECPSDFQAAEALVHQAVDLCNSCQTAQANALAAQAMAKTS